MIRNKNKFSLWLFISLVYMVLIYFISAMPYEQQDLKPLLEEKIQIPPEDVPDIQLNYGDQQVSSTNLYAFLEFIVRKSGHIIGYFILTVLLFITMSYVTIQRGLKFLVVGLLSISYAALDEWHQTFVPGRTGRLIDVYGVDLIGVLIGLIICFIVFRLRERRLF